MAARGLRNRLIRILASPRFQPSPIFREHPYLPSSYAATFKLNEYLRRTIHVSHGPEETKKDEACSSTGEVVAAEPKPDSDSYSAIKCSATSNLKISSRHDLAMIFTCTVCETRSMKTVCRESYEKGVVVVRCGGCSNLHLIADRLGWYGEKGSIEDILAARGEQVKKGCIDTVDLTVEDLAGKKL